MYIELARGSYVVRAAARPIGDTFASECEVMDYLRGLARAKDSAAKGFYALFRRFSEGGQGKLTRELFHEVSKEEKIWEFIKGDHRVLCFLDANTVVITNAFMKKAQKTDSGEVAKAVAMRKEYLVFLNRAS